MNTFPTLIYQIFKEMFAWHACIHVQLRKKAKYVYMITAVLPIIFVRRVTEYNCIQIICYGT
jgi:hypothetical protein